MKRKLGPKGQVVVPKEIREKLGLMEGSTLTFEISGDTILVRPEPSPEEIVERFLSVKGNKLRRLVDWKSVLDEEYKVPAGR
ncbi:MAG TPA: AbrB/MazE/SpoVT family DNA-binding domain-containing protein [Thermoplasmata archaeon]